MKSERIKIAKKFKVGDKVHIGPSKPTDTKYYIRGTVLEIRSEEKGYLLRAFSQDCPGIYMFNKWDEDLIPRTDRKLKLLPVGYNGKYWEDL